MSYRRRKQLMAQMNVVPYIDVMLVLLIIFMVTSPMLSLTQGVDVELPQASAQALPENTLGPLIISLTANGELALQYDTEPTQTLPQAELLVRVQALLHLEPKRRVLLRADHSISHGEVVRLMAELQAVGVPGVGIMTRPPQTPPASPEPPPPGADS